MREPAAWRGAIQRRDIGHHLRVRILAADQPRLRGPDRTLEVVHPAHAGRVGLPDQQERLDATAGLSSQGGTRGRTHTRSLDVLLPTDAGTNIHLRTVSKPEKPLAVLLAKLGLTIPQTPKQLENVV